MSAPTSLQRSSWKAEAIRRGDLKISGPMPITEDMPLNEEEEKEFAEKGGLESSLQSQDVPEEPIHRPETPPQPSQPPPGVPVQASALRSNPIEEQSPQPEESFVRPPTRSPPRMRQVVEDVQRQSVVQSIPLSSPSPYQATPASTPTSTQKKKRKSGLRGVFRKMFGRKSRDENDIGEDDAVHQGHSYHHSDPAVLQRHSPPREQKTPSGPRISDLPVKDLQPLHPLGQHLPFPMNVNAPQASPPHDYLTFDSQKLDFVRRRATLPTVPSASTHRHSLDESRGRLSTWEERLEDDGMHSAGIGIALSSPTQATTLPHKRRSRSADALFDLVKGHASFEGGRSAEIKRWRESYMSGSVYSRPQTAKTVETVRSVQIQEPNIQERKPEAAHEMSATMSHTVDPETPLEAEREREPEREIQAPVSAFNFGNLQNEHMVADHLSEVPSEAPTPPVRSQNRVPIEDRIQHLESAYENLEGSLRRMSTRNNRQTIILENAPKNLRTRDRSASTRSVSASRSHSRSQPSIHQEPIHQSSSDTLNPGLPSPILPQPPNTIHIPDQSSKDVLQTVFEALKHERSARKALEAQVRTLHHDISDLHALVNKLIISATATSPSYPTPSPDTLVMSTPEDRLLTPRADRKLEYGGGAGQTADVRQSALSKFSRSENGSVSEYDGSSVRGNDDVPTPDVWATPKEEGFGGSGFFTGDGRVRGYA
ncbi:hypothetical protein T440DRAFT_517273 [Plenodomus tracheiphilus IPT5]|uniref:Uncharacterized protein n=1 Tax=Plenodomus tracheiphilus IPT5 TaxID=1408161 RepID=A0A6A7B8U7_9PLEO|nr:hypothetical protein T440DRAFT_517273 [Plenodomus tracheiphilus IPT5]